MQQLSVLVVHGSYSKVYAQEFAQLIEQVKSDVHQPVLGAYLECTDVSLAEQIADFVASNNNSAAGIQLRILPLFLLPGVHVEQDILEAIADLRSRLPATVEIKLLDYLGKDCRLAAILKAQIQHYPQAYPVLLAHGSRRTGANLEITKLAQDLQAAVAYWSTEPSLEQTIMVLVQQKVVELYVVPYFLFSGRIPAAIREQITQLQQDWPQIQLHCGQPLGTEVDCAVAIAQCLNP